MQPLRAQCRNSLIASRAFEPVERRVEGACPGAASFSSLALHGPQFCPREPLNTTQQIGEVL